MSGTLTRTGLLSLYMEPNVPVCTEKCDHPVSGLPPFPLEILHFLSWPAEGDN